LVQSQARKRHCEIGAAEMLGASIGAIGTSMAQQHLRNVPADLNVPTLAKPEALMHAKDGCLTRPTTLVNTAGHFCKDG
jgi:NAD(P)H-dependent FMN reductase